MEPERPNHADSYRPCCRHLHRDSHQLYRLRRNADCDYHTAHADIAHHIICCRYLRQQQRIGNGDGHQRNTRVYLFLGTERWNNSHCHRPGRRNIYSNRYGCQRMYPHRNSDRRKHRCSNSRIRTGGQPVLYRQQLFIHQYRNNRSRRYLFVELRWKLYTRYLHSTEPNRCYLFRARNLYGYANRYAGLMHKYLFANHHGLPKSNGDHITITCNIVLGRIAGAYRHCVHSLQLYMVASNRTQRNYGSNSDRFAYSNYHIHRNGHHTERVHRDRNSNDYDQPLA